MTVKFICLLILLKKLLMQALPNLRTALMMFADEKVITIYLKLNDSKTEFIVIGSKQQLEKVSISHIRVGSSNIEPSSEIRNLGVMFDTS